MELEHYGKHCFSINSCYAFNTNTYRWDRSLSAPLYSMTMVRKVGNVKLG